MGFEKAVFNATKYHNFQYSFDPQIDPQAPKQPGSEANGQKHRC
jgi:hypothetical protein